MPPSFLGWTVGLSFSSPEEHHPSTQSRHQSSGPRMGTSQALSVCFMCSFFKLSTTWPQVLAGAERGLFFTYKQYRKKKIEVNYPAPA